MARSNGGLSWSEQWSGSRSDGDGGGTGQFGADSKKSKSSKRLEDAKASAGMGLAKAKVVASAGAEKARIVAGVGAAKAKIGALKVKSGAVTGFKWVKEQYSKKTKK